MGSVIKWEAGLRLCVWRDHAHVVGERVALSAPGPTGRGKAGALHCRQEHNFREERGTRKQTDGGRISSRGSRRRSENQSHGLEGAQSKAGAGASRGLAAPPGTPPLTALWSPTPPGIHPAVLWQGLFNPERPAHAPWGQGWPVERLQGPSVRDRVPGRKGQKHCPAGVPGHPPSATCPPHWSPCARLSWCPCVFTPEGPWCI